METKQPKSLGQLARRISSWTSNSLLTVMLLVIALGFGREVLHWWHDDKTPPAGARPGPLGDGAGPRMLEFGDQAWSIRRQEFSGRQGDVPAALETACRAAICDARPHGESAGAAEQELLKRLAGERPVAEQRGQWRIYLWGKGNAVLIATRAVGAGATSDEDGRAKAHPTAETSLDRTGRAKAHPTAEGGLDENGRAKAHPTAGTNLDETAYRVVIWGVAVPATGDAWTLYLFQAGGAGGQSQSEVEIPLPPGGHRLLSIRAAGGEAITAFSADDGGGARGFYDRWFAEHGWTVTAGWQQIATGWHARFENRSQGPARTADIRLGPDPQGRWTGLVMESL